MCLSVPARIVAVEGQTAQVEVYAQRRQVFLPIEGVKPGDWVLVYGSVALARLDEKAAAETIALIGKLAGD